MNLDTCTDLDFAERTNYRTLTHPKEPPWT